MKSSITLAAILILFSGCRVFKTHHNILNGIWIPIRQEMNGHQLPDSSFVGHRLTIQDSLYTYETYNIDKGITTYANGKMDIYGKDGANTGQHFKAIYKIENDTMTVCYDLSGKAYPNSYETSSNRFLFLSVLKRNGGQ